VGNWLNRIVIILGILMLWSCQSGTGDAAGNGEDGAYNPLADYDQKTPTTVHDVSVETASGYDPELVARGKYLAELLACGTCHTDGALIGEPNPERQFAGSRVGIAYSNPFSAPNPGVLYPANITPDPETGIGNWRDDELVRVIRTGVDQHGRTQIPVMPWPGFSRLSGSDALAIAAFLRSLPPVRHRVPVNVEPGDAAQSPYVHFGVYQSKRP
jgi:hypothetical protein